MSRPAFMAAILGAALLGGLVAWLARQGDVEAVRAQNASLQKELQHAQADRQAALAKAGGNEMELENLRQDSLALAELREKLKTNAPSIDAPPGFFAGTNSSVYVTYPANDPVLRSFLRWVMGREVDSKSKGRMIFEKICAACHQPDGKGKEGVGPPLAGSEWIKEPGGQRLVRIVLNGLNGPIQVQGKTWNLVMPPWRDNLDDDQIAMVLNYIRAQWGGQGAVPLKPALTASARQESHPKPETSEELLRLRP